MTKVDFYEVDKIYFGAFEHKSPSRLEQKVEPTKDGLREITFHGRVGTVCKRAFSNNSMLEAVNGIENVENIEEDPFSGTPFENKTV